MIIPGSGFLLKFPFLDSTLATRSFLSVYAIVLLSFSVKRYKHLQFPVVLNQLYWFLDWLLKSLSQNWKCFRVETYKLNSVVSLLSLFIVSKTRKDAVVLQCFPQNLNLILLV